MAIAANLAGLIARRRLGLSLQLILLAALLAGCATTETVLTAKGQGTVRNFRYGYERVFEATLAAAKANRLQIGEVDRANGRISLSNSISWWSWGERIAVFIKGGSGPSTEVEIVSKPVLSPLNFPPDWQQILLDRIDAELRDTGK